MRKRRRAQRPQHSSSVKAFSMTRTQILYSIPIWLKNQERSSSTPTHPVNILSILLQFYVVVKTFHYKFYMKLFENFVFVRNLKKSIFWPQFWEIKFHFLKLCWLSVIRRVDLFRAQRAGKLWYFMPSP